MAHTNFHLAPPAKVVDGLAAVPIEIQSIDGTLVFDGATSAAEADITIEFIAGTTDGCPVFDLRQTITEAWLDGATLTLAQIAHHDFGGGPNAEQLSRRPPGRFGWARGFTFQKRQERKHFQAAYRATHAVAATRIGRRRGRNSSSVDRWKPKGGA